MDTNKKTGLKIIVFTVIFWLFEIWYFKENKVSESFFETICDSCVWVLFGYSFSLMFLKMSLDF